MKKLGIIGFGVMGEAFVAGLRRQKPDLPIVVFDVKKERVEAARSHGGLEIAASASEAARDSDLVLLCVKPQDAKSLLAQIHDNTRGKHVVSILAGTSIATLSAGLETVEIARFMPNIAAVLGKALVGVSYHQSSSDAFKEECLAIARALGTPIEIPERLMAAVTGISGSGIAFALSFIHAMAQGGVASGFDYPMALRIAAETVEGAARLVADGTHPMELVSRVTSPAGTTIQGIRVLEKGGFAAIVMEAVEAAGRRARELEG
jgi:pyrroline-5-carboxylate reductase